MMMMMMDAVVGTNKRCGLSLHAVSHIFDFVKRCQGSSAQTMTRRVSPDATWLSAALGQGAAKVSNCQVKERKHCHYL